MIKICIFFSFYNALQADYLLSEEQLWANGYPRWAKTDGGEQDEDMETDGRKFLELFYKLIIKYQFFPIYNKLSEPPARLVEIRQSELDAGKSRIPFVDDAGNYKKILFFLNLNNIKFKKFIIELSGIFIISRLKSQACIKINWKINLKFYIFSFFEFFFKLLFFSGLLIYYLFFRFFYQLSFY